MAAGAAGWTPEQGYQAGQRLAADSEVTAVLCGNDDLALCVLRALRDAGRQVPDDVSVVGFDDTPRAAFYSPSLTPVRLDLVSLGRACFRLLDRERSERGAAASPGVTAPALIVVTAPGRPLGDAWSSDRLPAPELDQPAPRLRSDEVRRGPRYERPILVQQWVRWLNRRTENFRSCQTD